MRFGYYHLLLLLLCVFGTLYIVGTVDSVLFLNIEIKSVISLAKDLWGDLFVTLVAVLIIDRIVKRSDLQRKVSILKHVKKSIVNAFINLIWGMRSPEDWQERLKEPNSEWDDFLNRVWNLRESTYIL